MSEMTLTTISQIGILALGGAAVFLVTRRDPWRRWGYIVGLSSTPFFIYANLEAGQWAPLILSFWYAISWTYGIYIYWIIPRKEVINVAKKLELADISKLEADAVTANHKSIVDAINKLVANQKAIAVAAGLIKKDK